MQLIFFLTSQQIQEQIRFYVVGVLSKKLF